MNIEMLANSSARLSAAKQAVVDFENMLNSLQHSLARAREELEKAEASYRGQMEQNGERTSGK